MPEPPSWWKGKAYKYKEYLKQRNPGEASSDVVEYIETSGVGRPKRKAAKNPPSYLASDSAFEDDDLEEIHVSKKTKRDTLKNLTTSVNVITTEDFLVDTEVPMDSNQSKTQVIVKKSFIISL